MLRYLDISRSRLPLAWVGGVLMTGVVLSAALFVQVRRAEQREIDLRCTDVMHAQLAQLQITILRSMEVLHSVAALVRANGGLHRTHFREFVAPALQRQPELQALSWNPVVPSDRRTEFEQTNPVDGSSPFYFRELTARGEMVKAGPRTDYVPVLFIEPLAGNIAALGLDLNSDPSRREALERARDTGKPVATLPVRLAQATQAEPGLLVLLPVYAGELPQSIKERRSSLRGFAVAVFRIPSLVQATFRHLNEQGIQARLHDQSPHTPAIYGELDDERAANSSVAWLDVSGRQWAVVYHPTAPWLAAQGQSQSWFVLGTGLMFTLLATGYLYGGWRRTQEIAQANKMLEKEVCIRQEAERAAASANQAKSDFLTSMSHEIRTPLNAIMGYAQLMRRDVHATPEQRDAISGILTSGEHLLGLINEVLDLAKIEAGRMELQPVDFDLRSLASRLAATFKPLCAQKRIGFRISFDSSAQTPVRGDEGKLRQVLINLIGNSVKFTTAGEVCLCFRTVSADGWLFEVIDTGLGIPEEEQKDIFKPFQQGSGTQHQGGTGLGLAIARRQVELLGGNLCLESARGIGSRFFFTIPLPAGTATPPHAEDEVDVQLSGASSKVALPEGLCARLSVAAELHSSTALKAALQELRQFGPEACNLAERLRHHLRSFDMDAVQQVLLRHVVASPGDAGTPSPHEACGTAQRTS